MRHGFWIALSLCGVAVLIAEPPPAPPAEFVPPLGYVCYRAPSPIAIDGKLDDAAWAAAPWTAEFVDIEGAKKPKPPLRTRVKMLWDDTHFYIAAELEEPHVWGTITKHDAVIFQDNDFEVFLDPDGDSHVYGELELNALNTTWDLLLTKPYKDGGKAINGWEIAGLKSAVHVNGTLNDPSDTDKGWSLEIAIPWPAVTETLREAGKPPADGDQWRVNFSRVEWQTTIAAGKYQKVPKKPEDNWVWSPQGVIDMHRPETWGVVQFSTAAPGKAEYRPDPSLPTRHLLHRVYYAQQAYRTQHKRYSADLAELGLGDLGGVVRMQTTANWFEATAAPKPQRRRATIQSDGRVWAD